VALAAEGRLAMAEREAAASKRQLAADGASKGTLAFGGANPTAPARTQQGYFSLRAAPELEGLSPEERRRRVQAMNMESWETANAPLYRLLNFNAAQREQFRTLRAQHMVRQDEQVDAIMKNARAQTPSLDRAALQQVFQAEVQRSHAEWMTAVRGAFGDAVVQTIEHYADTGPVREVTKELSGALMYSDTPLTIPLAEQLVEILARHSRDAQGKVDLGAMKIDAIAADAATILTPAQIAALRRAHEAVQRKWVTPSPVAPSPAAARPDGG
jgi:hypothetical protein